MSSIKESFVNDRFLAAMHYKAVTSIAATDLSLTSEHKSQIQFFAKPAELRTPEEKKQILPFFRNVPAFKEIGI